MRRKDVKVDSFEWEEIQNLGEQLSNSRENLYLLEIYEYEIFEFLLIFIPCEESSILLFINNVVVKFIYSGVRVY